MLQGIPRFWDPRFGRFVLGVLFLVPGLLFLGILLLRVLFLALVFGRSRSWRPVPARCDHCEY
jgi:hypothetical protein